MRQSHLLLENIGDVPMWNMEVNGPVLKQVFCDEQPSDEPWLSNVFFW